MTEEAKTLCRQYLDDIGVIKKEERKIGIIMFYLGYYKGQIPPFVSICLMSGRIEELI